MKSWIMIVSAISALAADHRFHEVARFNIGGTGGWDYALVDEAAGRLYIARADRVVVIDESTGKIAGEIPGFDGAHGVTLDKKAGRGFASSGKSGEIVAFDIASLKTLAKAKAGENPDAILYDAPSDQVLAFNGKSHDVSFFDANSLKSTGMIKVAGKPEFAASGGDGKVYVNIEDKNELAVLDTKLKTVLRSFKLDPCDEPTGLAMDTKTKRLIVGCGNKTAVIVDAESGKVLQTFKTGEGVDAVAFDSGHERAFISAGEGTLTILSEKAGVFHLIEDVPTVKSARTLAIDGKTERVFLPFAKLEPAPATQNKMRTRPAAVPGTFAVLVVGLK